MELDKLYIKSQESLFSAISAIDKNSLGVIFIVDDKKKLIGVLTDGDIRRALLNGKSLESSITKIVNKNFKSFHYNTSYQEISNSIDHKYKIIPLVDEKGILVDYATKDRINNIPIAAPSIGNEELNNVINCVKSGWISSQGRFVFDFEKQFSKLHNNFFALSVSNGCSTSSGIGVLGDRRRR